MHFMNQAAAWENSSRGARAQRQQAGAAAGARAHAAALSGSA